jgi:glutamyl-tRNA reductase
MDRIILIGLNHKTAPVNIRECLAFSQDETRSALGDLRAMATIEEAMLFSTCNRVELLVIAKESQNAA